MACSPKEMVIAARLLRLAANEFGNHGCNDFDLFEVMSPEEALALQRALHAWSGDMASVPTTTEGARWALDWLLMRYLADKLVRL